MDVSFRQIRSFLAVARTRSFTRAAAEMHLSQPALTVQIRTLEERLGVRLLDRNNRTVELTRVGRDMIPALQRALSDIDGVLQSVQDWGRDGGGAVHIGALPSFAAGVLPDIIVKFRAGSPRTRILVRDAIGDRLLDMVRGDDVDIGVVSAGVLPGDLDVVLTTSDRLVAVVPPGHPLAAVASISVADLAHHAMVVLDRATSVRQTVDAALAEDNVVIPVACEVTYMITAVAMVRAGLGVTLLPGSAEEVRSAIDLVVRPIADARFARQIQVVRHRGRTLAPAAMAFLDLLTSSLSPA